MGTLGKFLVGFSGLAALAAGCKPDLGDPPSLINGPRILGVRQEPPEARPQVTVAAEALVVDLNGRLQLPATAYQWSLCQASKPPAENNIVNVDCARGGEGLLPLPDVAGPQVMLTIPDDACARQGPDLPPVKEGQPPIRPRDADVTGGYYQPFGLTVAASPGSALEVFSLERIRCNLPNVGFDVVQDFQMRYKPNTNPLIAGLSLGGVPVVAATAEAPAIPASVTSGQVVTFEAAWTPESRESFPVYDVGQRKIVDHFEELTFSWFATGGEFDRDQTGHTEAEALFSITNTWTAPLVPGPVHLWLVLRDSRGGLSFAEYALTVI